MEGQDEGEAPSSPHVEGRTRCVRMTLTQGEAPSSLHVGGHTRCVRVGLGGRDGQVVVGELGYG